MIASVTLDHPLTVEHSLRRPGVSVRLRHVRKRALWEHEIEDIACQTMPVSFHFSCAGIEASSADMGESTTSVFATQVDVE